MIFLPQEDKMIEQYKAPDNYIPEETMISKMRFYSIGIVAVNKPLSSKDIEVTPKEELVFIDGDISDQRSDYKSKGTDAAGAAYETTIKSTSSVKATWLSLAGSNRVTAPDVRRGELVMLYQFGNAKQLYWTTLKEDIKLRKLETVIYAYSDTKDEAKDGKSDTTYYFEISTHKKTITLHTCKEDKEPYMYDIQLNTKEGLLTINDDIGNHIYLNSKDRRIELMNTDNSFVNIEKKNITISSSDSIIMKSKNITLQSTSHTTQASNIAISGGSSINISSPATSVN